MPGSKTAPIPRLPPIHRSRLVSLSAHLRQNVLVFVDPYSGAVLGTGAARKMNSIGSSRIFTASNISALLPNRIVEAVGGLALILGRHRLLFMVAALSRPAASSASAEPLTNACSGVTSMPLPAQSAGALIFFLAISGMPWSGYWGEQVQRNACPVQDWAIQPSSGMMFPFRTVPTKDVLAIMPAGL